MIGIDTNVLLRNATQDDPVQSPQARAFMDGLSADAPGFISVVTIVETAWTLRTRYNADIDAIGGLISALVGAQELVVQEADIVRRVARESVTHHVDLVDLLIAHLGIAHGCDYTVTFDRKAARLPGMKLIDTYGGRVSTGSTTGTPRYSTGG